MKVSPNAPCPCGRDAKLKRCCGPYIAGRPVPHPELLVRARFTAYATGKVRFIMDTTHPEAPHRPEDTAAWRTELREHCRQVRFERLTIHDSEVHEADDRAEVSFTVQMSRDGQPAGFFERSRFLRDGNRWRYVSGDLESR